MTPTLTEFGVFEEKRDMNQILTKAPVCGLGSGPTWLGPPLLCRRCPPDGCPSGSSGSFPPREVPWVGESRIPAISPWSLIKCQLSLQLCDSLPIVSCFGVLWAAALHLRESQSHSLTPGPAHDGEEPFIHSKHVPGDSGGWVVDATSAQGFQAAALLGLLRVSESAEGVGWVR